MFCFYHSLILKLNVLLIQIIIYDFVYFAVYYLQIKIINCPFKLKFILFMFFIFVGWVFLFLTVVNIINLFWLHMIFNGFHIFFFRGEQQAEKVYSFYLIYSFIFLMLNILTFGCLGNKLKLNNKI